MTRLLLVDDDELVRTGLRMILDAEPDLEVVAETGDGVEVTSLVTRHAVDVVLMDVRMPGSTASPPPATSSGRSRTRRGCWC